MRAAIKAGEIYGAVLFAAGLVLGIARTLLLEPRLGDLPAVALELPVMFFLAWVLSGWVLRRWPVGPGAAPRLVMGAIALIVVILCEVVFVRLVFDIPFSGAVAQLVTPPGLLGLAGQLAAAAIPLLRRAV
jgi:hypothetical protein